MPHSVYSATHRLAIRAAARAIGVTNLAHVWASPPALRTFSPRCVTSDLNRLLSVDFTLSWKSVQGRIESGSASFREERDSSRKRWRQSRPKITRGAAAFGTAFRVGNAKQALTGCQRTPPPGALLGGESNFYGVVDAPRRQGISSAFFFLSLSLSCVAR